MATVVESLSIVDMKQTDFMQLREIFEHVMNEDIRWGRLDYWDARNKRLKNWLDNINEQLIGNIIKETK